MEQKMWNDSNLMVMYDMGMPGMMPPVTPGSAMTNGIGSLAPTTNLKRSISVRRIESEEEHSVEKNIPVYNFNKFHTMLTRGFYQWW